MIGRQRRAPAPISPREPLAPRTRRLARWMFYGHLWLGVLITGIVLILSVSGILLNHKRALGLMPDVAHSPSAPFEAALPMADLAARAAAAAPAAAGAGVDRMDVRPRGGIVKVRFRDDAVTVCVPACTSDAIFPLDEVPADKRQFIAANEAYFAAR